MNTDNDPSLNDMNCYDTSDVLQLGLPDSDNQIGFELSSSDYRRNNDCDTDTVSTNEIVDEPSKSITSYQLFDNDITRNEEWMLERETESCMTNQQKVYDEIYTPRKFKIWKCKYNCGKIFTEEKYMNSHILVMHENLKSISCKICFIHLSTESRLKNHMLRHSKVKHLICLICLKKRTKELSCMRHHLLNKHNISSKHSLFQESYYQMTLKEIAVEERSKKNFSREQNLNKFKLITKRSSTVALHDKLTEKAKLICDKLESLPKTNELDMKTSSHEESSPKLCGLIQSSNKKPKKIVTAENGMKLVKLPNGQFRKFTTTF